MIVGRVLAFGRADVRQIGRDPFLRVVLLGPVLILLAVRLGVPALTDWLLRHHGFDLAPLHPLVAAFMFVLLVPYLFGGLIGLLLLDERDQGILTALRVTPASLPGYGRYRAGLVMTATVVALVVCLPLSGLLAVPMVAALPSVGLAALAAPAWGLGLAAFATNKVEGLAALKIVSFVLSAPIGAWIAGSPWELAFGLAPTYWPAKAFWQAHLSGVVWPYALVGAAYHLAVLMWLARRLEVRLSR